MCHIHAIHFVQPSVCVAGDALGYQAVAQGEPMKSAHGHHGSGS